MGTDVRCWVTASCPGDLRSQAPRRARIQPCGCRLDCAIVPLYTDADDRQFAQAVYGGLTWRDLARTARTNLAAADRIAEKVARSPKVGNSRLRSARLEAHAHMVTAGLHAGLAYMLRTDDPSVLPPRITAASVKQVRTTVERASLEPAWLTLLRAQVAELSALASNAHDEQPDAVPPSSTSTAETPPPH